MKRRSSRSPLRGRAAPGEHPGKVLLPLPPVGSAPEGGGAGDGSLPRKDPPERPGGAPTQRG